MARLTRLFPGYLAVLLLTAIAAMIDGFPTVLTGATGLPWGEQAVLGVLNLFMVGQDWFQVVNLQRYFEGIGLVDGVNPVTAAIAGRMSPNFFADGWILIGQAWSLGAELLFYALAPYAVRSVRRILALLAASLAVRFGLIWGLGYSSAVWGYHFFPAVLCFFLLGSLSYHLLRGWRLRHGGLVRRIGGGFMLLYLAYAGYGVLHGRGMLVTFSYDTVKLWAAYLTFAASLPFVFALSANWRWDRWIGEMSYPVYLNHGLVLGLIPSVLGFSVHSRGGAIIGLAVSVVAAMILHLAVERPAAGLARRARPLALLRAGGWVAAGLCLAVLAGSGVAGAVGAPRVAVRPELLRQAYNYNIVRAGRIYYALPVGVQVNLGHDDLGKIEGILQADSLEAVLAQAAADPAHLPPRLLGVEGRYNIVAYGDRILVIPFGVPLTLNKQAMQHLPPQVRVVDLRDAPAAPALPELVQVEGRFNIVAFGGRFFVIPFGVPVDLMKDDPAHLPAAVRIAETRDEAVRLARAGL